MMDRVSVWVVFCSLGNRVKVGLRKGLEGISFVECCTSVQLFTLPPLWKGSVSLVRVGTAGCWFETGFFSFGPILDWRCLVRFVGAGGVGRHRDGDRRSCFEKQHATKELVSGALAGETEGVARVGYPRLGRSPIQKSWVGMVIQAKVCAEKVQANMAKMLDQCRKL